MPDWGGVIIGEGHLFFTGDKFGKTLSLASFIFKDKGRHASSAPPGFSFHDGTPYRQCSKYQWISAHAVLGVKLW